MVPIVIGDLAEQGQSVSMGEPLTSHDHGGIRPNLIVRIPQFMRPFFRRQIPEASKSQKGSISTERGI